MKRTNTNELKNLIGQKVLVKGWVSQIRELKKMTFIILREKNGYCQIISSRSLYESLSVESVIEVTGYVKEESQSKYGGYEIIAESITVTSLAETIHFQ